jgi:Zeta toxin
MRLPLSQASFWICVASNLLLSAIPLADGQGIMNTKKYYKVKFAFSLGSCWLALAVILLFSLAQAAEESSFYPGRLGIAKAKNLSPEERRVEARFAEYLESHTDAAIGRYTAKYGKEINTDNARELSVDYAPGGPEAEDSATRLARTKWSAAVQEPASALSKEIYRRMLLKTTPPKQRKQVVFTAGGAGVGKTTSIQQVSGLAGTLDGAEMIYDTTLSNFRSAMDRIRQGLAAGRMISIIFVYRDPVDSFVGGVLPRAERMGRTLPLEVFLDTHIGAAEALEKLAQTYDGDDRVAIAVINNSRGRGNAAPSNIAFVKSAAGKYRREELRAKLSVALDEAYEKGKKGEKDGISETVYKAIKGGAQ